MSETLPPKAPGPAGRPDPDDPSTYVAAPSALDRIGGSSAFRLVLLLAALAYVISVSIWLFVLIAAIVLSVFLHEMGHFLVAKRNGMKVTEFFIGFGPRIWSFRRGETEYGLKLIPAGAYVKIIGMNNLEEVSPSDEARAYRAKPFWKRMPVVLAGPVTNIALGLLLLFVVFAGFGTPSEDRWQIDAVTEGSAAAAAGLQTGDRIVAFQGRPAGDFDDFTSVVRAHAGMPVDLTVDRDGQELVVPATIGWSLTDPSASLLGLREGDRVRSVGGTETPTYPDVVGALQRAQGPVAVEADLAGGGETTFDVVGPVELPGDGFKGFLGVGPTPVLEHATVGEAAGDAVSQFGTIIAGSVEGMGRVFSPSGIANLFERVTGVNDDPVSEPSTSAPEPGSATPAPRPSGSSSDADLEDRPMSIIGIIDVGTQLGESTGWAGVLALLATVNIFLGLINLVPLLPFDGGHIAVACYEEVRSRISHRQHRVDMARLMPVTYVVLLLMVGLFMSTLYLDVADPVNLNP